MSLFRNRKGKIIRKEMIQENTDLSASDIPEKLPVLAKDTVVFPHTVIPIFVEDAPSLAAIKRAQEKDRLIAVLSLKHKTSKVSPANIYSVGVAGLIHRMVKVSQQGGMVILQGISKIRVLNYELAPGGYLMATVRVTPEVYRPSKEIEALAKTVLSSAQQVIKLTPFLPEELQNALENLEDPLKLTYLVASLIKMKLSDRQKLLEIESVKEKLEFMAKFLGRELELLKLGGKIQSDVQKEFSKAQREYYLRQQLKAIQKELGEESETTAEAKELREKVKEAKLPSEVEKQALEEIMRLERLHPMAAEYQVIRTYLDWILEVPWSKETKDKLDFKRAQDDLDKDHYGLKDAKERILEYLAVRKMQKEHRGPILCFVGPPGTGKTSLGQAIAETLGRKFVRMSLGGVHDEAEIRGHRRTYIGALPGRIIQGIKRAGSKNPVFMLDEVDKVGADFRGDPAAALLEVLDPEQNSHFHDNYLDLDFDLSKVMFITTANVLEPIHPALQDRMEILKLPGYTEEEKVLIVQRHLWPKQLKEHGLEKSQLNLSEAALKKIISEYTQEAGVRNLERQLAQICRKAVRLIVEEQRTTVNITEKNLVNLLGPQKVFPEVARRTAQAGVATGLAVTQSGGEILFVEARKMPGKKGFTLTGQLGDVMKESATAALSLIRSRAKELEIDKQFFEKNDLHLHVPSGAIPKDGPSAGVVMVVALASLLTGKLVKNDVAMTGEITLSGLVLPIGGIKEKVLAARRAGIKTVILPRRNEGELEEIEKELKKGMKFVLVEKVDEVLKEAFK